MRGSILRNSISWDSILQDIVDKKVFCKRVFGRIVFKWKYWRIVFDRIALLVGRRGVWCINLHFVEALWSQNNHHKDHHHCQDHDLHNQHDHHEHCHAHDLQSHCDHMIEKNIMVNSERLLMQNLMHHRKCSLITEWHRSEKRSNKGGQIFDHHNKIFDHHNQTFYHHNQTFDHHNQTFDHQRQTFDHHRQIVLVNVHPYLSGMAYMVSWMVDLVFSMVYLILRFALLVFGMVYLRMGREDSQV